MSGLHDAFDEIVAAVPAYGDLDRAIEQAGRERRRRYEVAAVLVAAAAVVAVIVGGLVVARRGGESPQPIRPVAPTTTAPERTTAAAGWRPPQPLRPAASRVVQLDHDRWGDALDWADARDADIAAIDIVSVAEGQDFHGGSSWRFRLAARPPLDPADRVIAYGIVVDGDGDRTADCQIGINNDALEGGAFHVWVTNLRTHETAVQDGSPYGVPVEFAHPAEQDLREYPPEMQFGFLRGLKHPDPCDPLGDSATFYAWSSVTEAGQVTGWDYAPNAAWLPIRWRWRQ
jgi:hypothetical protein